MHSENENEWEDLELENEEDDKTISYHDDSLSGDEDENEEYDEFLKPLGHG